MDTKTPTEALEMAVSLAGGQSALARQLATDDRPIKQGHVWAWLNRDRQIPPEFCLRVEALTGISRHDLRPDVFGPASPPEGEATHAA